MLDVALKEWAIVCDLLLEGQLAILLRKGGIHESGGPGVFELEYMRFLLCPSWAHQQPEMIKPAWRPRVQVMAEPEEITFQGVGQVARIWQVKSRQAFDSLDDLHCWTPPQVDMRFNYKPERPLYLMAVRASRLAAPRTIRNDMEYKGCRSWIPLKPADAVEDAGARPVLSDAAFDAILQRVDAAMR